MMRTDLDHLPEAKQRELARVVQILFEEFEAATASRSHKHLKHGRVLKVVLFGSYARGDWVGSQASRTLDRMLPSVRLVMHRGSGDASASGGFDQATRQSRQIAEDARWTPEAVNT